MSFQGGVFQQDSFEEVGAPTPLPDSYVNEWQVPQTVFRRNIIAQAFIAGLAVGAIDIPFNGPDAVAGTSIAQGPTYTKQVQYQAQAFLAPASGGHSFPETVSVDRWNQPWTDPVGRTNLGLTPRHPDLAFVSVVTAATETITVDKWFIPLSEPVKLPPRLAAANNEDYFGSESAQFPETVSEDRWHLPFSEPVRPKVGLGAHLQQFIAQSESAQFPESVTEDRWHQPWSDPVRWKGLHPASHQVLALTEAAPFAETVTESRWHQPWSEPVRFKLSVPAPAQQFIAQSESAQFPESVSEDRWHQPWSDPVRWRGLLPASQQALAFVEATPFAETVTESRWHQPWSEPVRLKPDLGAPRQQAAWLVEAAPFAETVSEDRWHQPWSDPVRRIATLSAASHPAIAFVPVVIVSNEVVTVDKWFMEMPRVTPARFLGPALQSTTAFVEAAPFPETVTESRWHQPWSEPVRWRGLHASSQQFLAYSESARFPEIVSEDRWHMPWTDPRVMAKLGLHASQQQALAFLAPFVFTETVTPDKWYIALSEPVRLKQALKAGAQRDEFLPLGAIYTITGVTRDQNLNPLPGATVHLFQTSTDVKIGTAVSAPTTAIYTITVTAFNGDPGACYCVALLPGSPDVFGTTDNTLRLTPS